MHVCLRRPLQGFLQHEFGRLTDCLRKLLDESRSGRGHLLHVDALPAEAKHFASHGLGILHQTNYEGRKFSSGKTNVAEWI